MKAFRMTNSTPLEDPRGSVQSDSRVYSTMTASDVMNPNVVSVGPDVSINQIARTLVENGISAVPVVDESDAPVGMVSEGDLIPRRELQREARRDWWLDLLAEGEALSDFVTNRTGFVVLHPLEGVSGAPVAVERVDGSVEQLAHIGSVQMQPGDVFVVETPGGGGYGPAA